MKIFLLAPIFVTVLLVSCTTYAPPGEVIPLSPDIIAIDVLLPPASEFNFTHRRDIDLIVSLLRERCHWTVSDERKIAPKEQKDIGYRIALQRIDGSTEIVYVVAESLRKKGYQSQISASTATELGDLCGVVSVRLQPFGETNRLTRR